MKFLLLLLILGAVGIQSAYAQGTTIPNDLNLTNEQILMILAVGFLAGITRALINWTNTEQGYSTKQGIRNILACVLATIPIGFTAVIGLEKISLLTYIVIFFAAYGGGAAFQNLNVNPQKAKSIINRANVFKKD